MRIARVILAILLLTSFAHARGFMTGVGPSGISGPYFQLACPSGGLVSVPSTNFTLTGQNGAVFNGTTNTVSMAAAPATGTFSPVSPATPAAGGTFSFTFTPGATPTLYSISVSDNFAVTVVPSSCSYNATSATAQNPLPLVIP